MQSPPLDDVVVTDGLGVVVVAAVGVVVVVVVAVLICLPSLPVAASVSGTAASGFDEELSMRWSVNLTLSS